MGVLMGNARVGRLSKARTQLVHVGVSSNPYFMR